MAGVSLLALIDKIAVVLDDVALMTKVAAKKTAGVLGDDLALNAQQVSGVKADRALAVIGTIAMFLVGGSIFTHNIVLKLTPFVFDALIGLISGAIVLILVSSLGYIPRKKV